MNMTTRDKAIQEWTSIHVTTYSNLKYFFAFSFRLSKEQWALNLLSVFLVKNDEISPNLRDITHAGSLCWFPTEKFSRIKWSSEIWHLPNYITESAPLNPPPPFISLSLFSLRLWYITLLLWLGGDGSQVKREAVWASINTYIYPTHNCVSPTPCN